MINSFLADCFSINEFHNLMVEIIRMPKSLLEKSKEYGDCSTHIWGADIQFHDLNEIHIVSGEFVNKFDLNDMFFDCHKYHEEKCVICKKIGEPATRTPKPFRAQT